MMDAIKKGVSPRRGPTEEHRTLRRYAEAPKHIDPRKQ